MTVKFRRTAIYLVLTSYLTSSTPTSSTGPNSHNTQSSHPPSNNPDSSHLTKQLLSLDLGFTVLNDQILRENIGVGIKNQQDKSEERSDHFFGDDEEFFGNEEYLPSASALVSKDQYQYGPSPDSWNTHERFFFTLPGFRRRAPPPRDKFFVGDQSQCLTGSCEFFLFCWMQGGIVEGGCGGFMMSCCNRPNTVGHKTIVTQVGPKFGTQLIWTGDLKQIVTSNNVRKYENLTVFVRPPFYKMNYALI